MWRATEELATNHPHLSAKTPSPLWMKFFGTAIAMSIGCVAVIWTDLLPSLLILLLLPYFILSIALKTVLAVTALRAVDEQPPATTNEPIVTIFVPLRNEEMTLPALIKALERLDYPPSKLDIKLLVEEDDPVTRGALALLSLPAHIEIVLIPECQPRTKPKAMNYALPRARGEIVGIYDAEDQPEPDQLRIAVAALTAASPDVVCVQSRLNHYNAHEGVLQGLASMEYALWFDMLLNGLSRLSLPVPLGGTSLFVKTDVLREIGAWDPYNVTEDADLGVRLARSGYKSQVIASTTHEEALKSPFKWITQRSRWVKGFMVTWIVHMRDPMGLVRELGWKNTIAINVMLLDGFIAYLIQPFLWFAIIYWFTTGTAPWSDSFGEGTTLAIGSLFFFGQGLILTMTAAAVAKRFGFLRALWSPLIWFYWQLGTIAAYRALWELFTNRFGWSKTDHGESDSAEQRRKDALGLS